MRILIINNGVIPVYAYGGTERVIWGLGKELVRLGHKVTYLVNKGSYCDFAEVLHIDEARSIIEQVKGNFDVIHFNFQPDRLESLCLPYIITIHGNSNDDKVMDINSVFVSKNHAARYNSNSSVYNGLDWSEYKKPDFKIKRKYFHFLGNASWRVKNIAGAIDVVKGTKSEQLKVMGGVRFNFKMGLRLTFSPRISFEGMVGGDKKYDLINGSKGLIFPVLWHEPFGLAIIESLYYGSPVFGTPYGALPELVKDEVGFLSNKKSELSEAMLGANNFNPITCHHYAVEMFNSQKMASEYISRYERVIAGEQLNQTPPRLKEIQNYKFLDWS
jgi:glycosyltransferase involved in cell wall biosynthesis